MTEQPATRVLPRPGDFGIKPGGGWAMWLVRLGTFSRYGHAAEVVETRPNQPNNPWPVRIVEATPSGVIDRWVSVDEFRWSTGGPLDKVLTDEMRWDIIARAFKQRGKGYDWPSIGKFLVRFFNAKFKGWSPDHPDRKLFCSELIVWNRRETSIKFGFPELDMFPGTAPGDISPGQLQDWCPRTPDDKP